MDNRLDFSGLSHYDDKIKDYIDSKISPSGDRVLLEYPITQYTFAEIKSILESGKSISLIERNNSNKVVYEYQAINVYFASNTEIVLEFIENDTITYKGTSYDTIDTNVYSVKNDNTWFGQTKCIAPSRYYTDAKLTEKQPLLVSGENIKTIDGTSILGSGNISFSNTYGNANLSVNASGAGEEGAKISKNSGAYIKLDNDTSGVKLDIKNNAGSTYIDKVIADKDYVDGKTSQATESTLGTIKLNPSKSITLNSGGQLEVGGRMGQFEGTTGLFAPNDREPRAVGDYSLLITDAKGMDIGNRAFAVVSGYGLTCKSAAAGSTQYRITNNYANRIIAKMCENGYISRDEATSKVERVVPVVSVQINGSSFTPDSSANSSTDIIITTAETLNPDSAITNIRLFGKMQSYATVHTGNGVASWGGGRNLILGGAVTKAGSSNDNCLVGMNIYSSGNGNACFGRQHIAVKNRGFLAGTGHDTSNAPSEGASAVGQYSYMDSSTLFAVGNGTAHTARSNAFEVRTDGIVLKSPNGTRYKITVDNSGNLTTTAI